MIRASLTLLLCVCALLVGGCSSDGEQATIERSELPRLVLQPADLSAAFVQFDEGRQVLADAHPGPREDEERFGRREGWKARYRRVSDFTARGASVIESRADLFRDVGGAKRDLDAYRDELKEQIPGSGAVRKLIDAPKIGDGVVAAELRQSPAVFFTIAWREANATASVTVQGSTSRTKLSDAIALARRQERRLARAAAR